MSIFDYGSVEFRSLPDVCTEAQAKDRLFMFAHALLPDSVPMWKGFNSRLHVDHIQKQTVHYMPNLDAPITRHDVVAHTMRLALECAKECNQRYGLVTYDLDVAMKAYRIQATEYPVYKDLFIMQGPFHIYLCFFRATGKILAESGGPEILVDSGVLAPGSLRSFVECFNYNRCRRLHPLFALALEMLHFKSFLRVSRLDFNAADEAKSWDVTTADGVRSILQGEVFRNMNVAYENYRTNTLRGENGPTAQFYMTYVQLIGQFHLLDRSIRENDLNMFVLVLTPIIDFFFATNRTFYSRWLAKYQLDLLNIDETHPGLRELLTAGGLSVRRTDNQFSRSPIDLTLEQTVNADAASRMTGFSNATNNYSARLRWSVTKAARAALISETYEMAGMGHHSDSHTELSPARIIRDNDDLQKIIVQIQSTLNPFEETELPLVNLVSGRQASLEVAESLSTFMEAGAARHDEFVAECLEDTSRFEKTIKRHPLKTFAKDGAVNRKSDANQAAQLKCTSRLLGRLAFSAAMANVDLEYVFSFPLTPVPLAFFKCDGSPNKTDKSALSRHLEQKVQGPHNSPSGPGATIIDGNFLVHTMPSAQPGTYGGLSENILRTALSTADCGPIHVCFDTYERPSIKDAERNLRGSCQESVVKITGPNQRREAQFSKQLQSESFKRCLPEFLAVDWESDRHAWQLKGRNVFLGDLRFYECNGHVYKETQSSLSETHPEADTAVIFHALYASQDDEQIVIRCADTDVLVLAAYHLEKFPPRCRLYLDFGTGNCRRYLSINQISESLGMAMCRALPGIHCMSGCDFLPAFARKGKIKPFQLVEKSVEFQEAFIALATGTVTESQRETLKCFVCVLYGAKRHVTLNRHRFLVAEKTFSKPAKAANPFDKLKDVNASTLPPCEAELDPQIDRAIFVANMWAAAHTSTVPTKPVVGWVLNERGYYQFEMFRGPQLPADLAPNDSEQGEESDEEVPPIGDLDWGSDDED